MSGISGRELRAEVRGGRAPLLPAAFAGDHLVRPTPPPCQVARAGEPGPACRAS
jgi:hypothetical protein